MKTKTEFCRLFVIGAVMSLCTAVLAIDDPNDLPELYDQSRQACSCSVDQQDTGDSGTEIAE